MPEETTPHFKQHIDIEAPKGATGMDAALTSLLMNQGKTEGMSAAEISMMTGGAGGGMGMGGGIWPLLLLMLAGGGNGLFGRGHGNEGPAQTLLEANVTGTPDIMAAVNAGNLSNATAFGTVGKDIVSSQAQVSRDIATGTIAISDRVANGFSAAQLQNANGFSAGQIAECQTQNLVSTVGATNAAATALGLCQTQNAISTQSGAIQLGQVQSQNAIQQQLAQCCCDNRLATANLTALINSQTCEIEKTVTNDGAATRALITANRIDDLQAQLNDAKSAVRDQTIIEAIIANKAAK